MEKKNCCRGTDVDPLPQEIVYEILLRVPVKSLCRFRCVSKRWFSIISNPRFLSSHYDRASALPKLLFVIPEVSKYSYESCGYILSVDYPECRRIVKDQDQDQDRPQESLSLTDHDSIVPSVLAETLISHSSGGLICLEFDSYLVVSNPISGETVTLDLHFCNKECRCITHFGFDPVQKEYKILSTVFVDDVKGKKVRIFVITLGKKMKWRRVNDGYPSHYCCSDFTHQVEPIGAGVCINGVIYYLSRNKSVKRYDLIAFNMRFETFEVIPLPTDAGRKGLYVMESDGCVAVVRMVSGYFMTEGDGKKIAVHTLKDASNRVWSCESFPVPADLSKHITKLCLVGFSKKGELLYAAIESEKYYFYICDLKGSTLRQIEVHGVPEDLEFPELYCGVKVSNHVENFVSLKGFSYRWY